MSGLEVAMVLDNTGSLSYVGSTGQSNFKQLQTAANKLTAALFGGANQQQFTFAGGCHSL